MSRWEPSTDCGEHLLIGLGEPALEYCGKRKILMKKKHLKVTVLDEANRTPFQKKKKNNLF